MKTVAEYIRTHPSIKDALALGVINYAALSRQIVLELGQEVSSQEAVVISLRRLRAQLPSRSHQRRIVLLLQNSALEIKNRICIVTLNKERVPDALLDEEAKTKKARRLFFMIEGTESITLIIQVEDLERIKKRFKSSIVEVLEDMSLISLHCEGVQAVPGVAAYLSSLFYEHGVNIYEFMSCWTDNLFVVRTPDVGQVVQFLEF